MLRQKIEGKKTTKGKYRKREIQTNHKILITQEKIEFEELKSKLKCNLCIPIFDIFFRHWGSNEPDPSEAPACGALQSNGVLLSFTCDATKNYICERYLGKPPTCPKNWIDYGNYCYKVGNTCTCYNAHYHDRLIFVIYKSYLNR